MRVHTAEDSCSLGALEAHAPCYVWRFNESGHCTDWNHEASKLLKSKQDSFEGLNWMDLFSFYDSKKIKNFFTNPSGPAEFKIEAGLAHSKERMILITARRLSNESADFLGYIASGIDISELHQTRMHMLKTSRELEISNQELEQYAYVVSHDLQEPLRMITGFCDLLKEEYDSKLDGNGQEYVEFICDGARRMTQLIKSLLSYSQVSRKKVKTQPCDLKKTLTKTVLNLNPKIKELGAQILVSNDIPQVRANEVFLIQIFQNLIENALKYRHQDRKPEVQIDYQIRDEQVVVFIKDNGRGIAPQNHNRIFKLFQRGSSAEQEDGLGIGLALTKKLTESLEGRIEVESDGQSGSLFKVSLPLAGDQK